MRRASVVPRRFLGSFRAGHPRGGAVVLLAGALVLVIVVGAVTEAAAQTPAPADRRVVIGTSLGVQFVRDAIRNTIEFELFQERGEFAANYDITTDTAFDVTAAVRLWKRFGLGVELSYFYTLTTAALQADVPHPFFFGLPRSTSGSATGVTRRELAVHMQAQYWHVVTDTLLVRGFFGPTVFNVGHDLVTAIETQEVGFPFEQVTLTGHTKQRLNQSAPGFNLGLDIAYFGLRERGFLGHSPRLDHIALAFVLRYSRGTSAVMLDGGFQPSFELGGTHLGAGLRVGF